MAQNGMVPGMEHWKVTMLGDGGVGKTALAVQFTQKQFIGTYDPTIEDSYRKQVFVDGKMAFLEIIDTAGQEDYSTLREQWIREGQGFILVYSITNRNSFQNIERFRRTMNQLHPEMPVSIIVANKIDDPYRRETSKEEGLTYARRFNYEFIETSAKTGQGVERVFAEVVRQLRAHSKGLPLTPNSTIASSTGRSTRSGSGPGPGTPLTIPSSGSLHSTRPSRLPLQNIGTAEGSSSNYASSSRNPYPNPPAPTPPINGNHIPPSSDRFPIAIRPPQTPTLQSATSNGSMPGRNTAGVSGGSGFRPGNGPAPMRPGKPPKEKKDGKCIIA